MSSFNYINIVGNLGSDPEVRFLKDGTPVANFSIATNGRGENPITTWFRTSVFGKQAESVGQYLHKGSRAHVLGELELRTYPKNDGSQGTELSVRAINVKFLDPKPVEEAEPAQETGKTNDDIPF
jgi:single-strand DNA-binding protein